MIHFGFGTYCSPSWLLPQTLAHMTHTFHHAITAKSFIKEIKLTSRQRSTHISSRQCPSSSLNREIPSSSKIKNNLKRKTFLDFLLWHTFHLSICHCSVELTSKNTQIHFTTNTLIKPKFMKKVVGSCVHPCSSPLLQCEDAPRAQRHDNRGWEEVLEPKHLQTYTQESGEPGYCSALYEGLRVLA